MKFRRICDQLVPADQEAAEWYQSLAENDAVEVDVKIVRQRTPNQNNALHLFCRQLADALNDAGVDMLEFPWREGIALEWTGADVKERLWRPVQKAITGEVKTSKAITLDYPAVYEVLNRKIASETGVHVPWPEADRAA